MNDHGMERAQAAYDAMEPPEATASDHLKDALEHLRNATPHIEAAVAAIDEAGNRTAFIIASKLEDDLAQLVALFVRHFERSN